MIVKNLAVLKEKTRMSQRCGLGPKDVPMLGCVSNGVYASWFAFVPIGPPCPHFNSGFPSVKGNRKIAI